MLRRNRAHAFAFVLSIVGSAKAEPNAAPASAAAPTAAPVPAAPQPAPTQPEGAAQPEPAAPVSEPAATPAPTGTAPAAPIARPPGDATPSTAAPKSTKHGERKRRPGVREHDGFYGRFGLGFSGFGDTVALEGPGDSFRDYALVTGFSTVSELAIGGTIKNGFVLGGGLYAASIETPFVFEGNGRPLPSEFRRPDSFAILGIMGDFYPNPRRGLHMQGALGVAALTGLNPGGSLWSDRHVAVGAGAMLGIGYDWWVGEQWSIGVLARGTAGAMAEDDAHGARWFHFAAAWPSILLTVTYH